MPRRYYVQRQHIIHSLDTLLYQLHTLSFFLAPSIWIYVFRMVSQFQCSKPRELDSSRSLRFFFATALFFNLPSLWSHSYRGLSEGKVIILDFVGMSYLPSKFQLLTLDLLIVILQLLLITIAYETSVYYDNEAEDPEDILLPSTPVPSTLSFPWFQSSLDTSSNSIPFSPSLPSKTMSPTNAVPTVVDLRFTTIMRHFRHPPPPSRSAVVDPVLPLPNTTPWPLPAGMRMLMRASRQIRDVGGAGAPTGAPVNGGREVTVPGAIDVQD